MAGISVLVVDDHALFADALQARLRRERDLGPITVAYNARDALQQASATRPTVVILDLILNDRSGLDLVEDVRRVSPESNIIILTAVDSVEDVVTAVSRGARAWLPKTVAADYLVRVVHGVSRGEAWLAPDLLGRVLTDLPARTAGQPSESGQGGDVGMMTTLGERLAALKDTIDRNVLVVFILGLRIQRMELRRARRAG